MSGVQIDLDIRDEFSDDVEEVLAQFPGARDAALLALGEDLVGNMKREVPTNTSRLKGTIRTEQRGMTGLASVIAGGQQGVDYTLPVLEGSEPHAPGSPDPTQNRSLSRWADRNNYPGGFESIYWSIYHYGTEGTDFVTDPIEQTQRDADGVVAQVFRNRGIL